MTFEVFKTGSELNIRLGDHCGIVWSPPMMNELAVQHHTQFSVAIPPSPAASYCSLLIAVIRSASIKHR
jgi:hypothetical protein